MSTATTPVTAESGTARKAGWVLSGLVGAFLLFDAVGKLLKIGPVEDSAAELGLPMHIIVPIGVVLLLCTVLYLVPRTAPLGAVLLTGYLGGGGAHQLARREAVVQHGAVRGVRRNRGLGGSVPARPQGPRTAPAAPRGLTRAGRAR